MGVLDACVPKDVFSYFEQLKDILPSILIAVFMACVVSLLNLITMNSLIRLVVQILIGALIYIGLSYLFKIESFSYMISIIKDYKRKKQENKDE